MYSYVGMGQLLLAAMCSVCSEQATHPSIVGFLLACFWGSMLHGHCRQTTMALLTRVEPGEPHKL